MSNINYMTLLIKDKNNLVALFKIYLTIMITYCLIEFTEVTITILLVLFFLYLYLFHTKLCLILLIFSSTILDKLFFLISGIQLPYSFYYPYFMLIIFLLYENMILRKITYFTISFIDFAMLLLIVYLLFSVVSISSDKSYGFDKLQFLLTSILLFYIPNLISKCKNSLLVFYKAILIFGLILGLYIILQLLNIETYFIKDYGGRFSVLNQNPIWMARYFSYALIVDSSFLVKYCKDYMYNILKIILLILILLLFFYFILITGSRGPLLALLLALLIILITKSKTTLLKSVSIILSIFLVFLVFSLFLPVDIYERIINSNEDGKLTVLIRLLINLEAISNFKENIIYGIGFGSYKFDYPLFETLKYPHNIFLELLSETGIIGFSLLCFIVFTPLIRFIKKRKEISKDYYYSIMSLYLIAFFNSNLSGHVGTNIYLWFSAGVMHSITTSLNSSNNLHKP